MIIKLTPSNNDYASVTFDTDNIPLVFNAQNGTVRVERVDQNAVESATTGLQQLKAEIAAIADRMSNRVWSDDSEMDFINKLIDELRQLSAV
jgi:hypothetical protein